MDIICPWVIIQYNVIYLLLDFFQFWPLALSIGSRFPLTFPLILFVEPSLLSDTIKCSRLILHVPSPKYRISHFT